MNALQLSPASLDELKQVLQLAQKRNQRVIVKSSSNSTAERINGSEVVVNMKKFNKIIEIDITEQTVTVEPSVTFHTLDIYLKKVGMSFPMCGLPEEMTIASAVSTGMRCGMLNQGMICTFVKNFQILTSSNKIVTCRPNSDYHSAICNGFGSCGIIIGLTLQCEPRFELAVDQYGCSMDTVVNNLSQFIEKYPNLKVDWFPHTNNAVIKSIKKIPPVTNIKECVVNRSIDWVLDDLFGCRLLEIFYSICLFFPFLLPLCHVIVFYLAFVWKRCKIITGDSKPNSQITSAQTTEWMISTDDAIAALRDLQHWCSASVHFLHFPIRLRFIKGDDVYLSPTFASNTCAISLTINRPSSFYFPFERAFEDFGKLMQRYNAKPNLSITKPIVDIEQHFPQFEKWSAIRNKLDPIDLFVNKFE